jgi:hypothetical protein
VLPTDYRFGVSELLVDERVTHYWDGQRLAEEHYAAQTRTPTPFYDVFFVYEPGTGWADRPAATGAPVVSSGALLMAALHPFLE